MANFTQNNVGNTRGTPFKKGNAGRPRSARNKAILAAEAPAGRSGRGLDPKGRGTGTGGQYAGPEGMPGLRVATAQLLPHPD